MKRQHYIYILQIVLLMSVVASCAEQEQVIVPPADFPQEYIDVTHERAANILKEMNVEDPAKAKRVEDIIAQQYQDLSAIQDTRDAQIEAAKEKFKSEEKAEAHIQEIRALAQSRTDALHKQYVSKLAAELTSELVAQVKNGMTYNVAPITYKAYLRLLPDLTKEQKKVIWDYLVEAREHAIDAGSSEKKHAVFNDYKGKINNYVSAKGYNLSKAEERLRKRQEAQ